MSEISTYPLRLPKSLKEEVSKMADRDGTSVNQFIAMAVAEKVSALETAEFFNKRAQQADLKSFKQILFRDGGQPPRINDETSISFPVNEKTQFVILKALADSYPDTVNPEEILPDMLKSVDRELYKSDPLKFVEANVLYLLEKKLVISQNQDITLTAEGVDAWKSKLTSCIDASDMANRSKSKYKKGINAISDLNTLMSFVKSSSEALLKLLGITPPIL